MGCQRGVLPKSDIPNPKYTEGISFLFKFVHKVGLFFCIFLNKTTFVKNKKNGNG
jgi:hypothetical protein